MHCTLLFEAVLRIWIWFFYRIRIHIRFQNMVESGSDIGLNQHPYKFKPFLAECIDQSYNTVYQLY